MSGAVSDERHVSRRRDQHAAPSALSSLTLCSQLALGQSGIHFNVTFGPLLSWLACDAFQPLPFMQKEANFGVQSV